MNDFVGLLGQKTRGDLAIKTKALKDDKYIKPGITIINTTGIRDIAEYGTAQADSVTPRCYSNLELPVLFITQVRLTLLEEFDQAVAMHCARGGEKLHRQRLAASHLTIFISTSRFRQNPDEVYSAAANWQLPFPTSYIPALIAAAQSLLERIYKPWFVYHKAGIFLSDIVADAERQQSILAGIDDDRRVRVMRAVDEINWKHGRDTVRPLAVNSERGWEMRRQHLSPRYTTRLGEVLSVKAG